MSEAATKAPSEGLQWVRKELATTIVDARTHLEKFSEHQEDRTPLIAVADLLHLAHGALRMVEVYGAALLVEEMMSVAKQLQSETFAGADDALEALSRAIVQLPAYLDRVAGGGNDVPLVLLPLLNDLRAVRGSPLLSESSLFVLNVDQGSSTPRRVVPPASVDYKVLARKIRPHYQRSLLGWLRGEEIAKNLHILGEAARKLEEGAATTRVFQFWWVLGGVVEAIKHDGLRPSAAVKRLLGQADQQLKILSQNGEAIFAQEPPLSLLNSLLYYVARADSKTEKVLAIKSSFSLTDIMQPGETSDSDDLTLLQAPSVNLMKTVGAAIKQDMSNVKDSIDIFVRTKSDQHQELLPQADSLQKLSDTLGVVGLDELRQQIAREAERLRQFVAASSDDDEDLLNIAATLINVEAAIDEQLLGVIIPQVRHANAVSQSAAEMAADVERKEVVAAVLRECIVNLTRIKETLSQFIEHPDRGAVLDGIPNLIKGICAGLSILDKTRAVEVLLQVEWHINAITGDKNFGSHTHELDRLADAIVSVEYYMDTVRNGRGDPWYMLDNAQASLKSIKRQPSDAQVKLDSTADDQATRQDDIAQSTEPDTADERAAKPATHQPAPAEQASIDGHIEATGVRAAVTAAAASARKQKRTGWMPALDQPLSALHGKRVDPELLELFIEEAKEEMASLRRSLPRWQQNVEDREVLLSIRRSFHTLKGSGRMVGANLIGEYAWGLENLTNKVVAQSLPADERVIQILSDGVDKLPQLIEQLEIGTPPEPALAELIDSAWILSDEPYAVAEARRESDISADVVEVESAEADSEVALEGINERDSTAVDQIEEVQDVIDIEQTAITKVLTERVSINDVTPIDTNLSSSDSAELAQLNQNVDIPIDESNELTSSGEKALLSDALEQADDREISGEIEHSQREAAQSADTASIDAATTGAVPGVVLEMQPLAPELSDADDHPRPTAPAIELDQALHQIFLKESLEHLETINQFIDEVSGHVAPFAVSEPLHRAWHTLSGSANTANISAAAAIATPINQHLRNLRAEGQPLSNEAVNILHRASKALEEIVRGINRQLVLPNVDQLLLDIDTLPVLGADATAQLKKLESTGEIEIPTLSAITGPGYDLEIAAIFAEEAVEILDTSDAALTEWFAQSDVHTPQLEDLLRHLHTLKGGARMAGIVAMGDLSHDTESLIERVRDKQQAFNADCKNVLQQCVDQLHSMTDDLLHNRAVPDADALLQRIAQLGDVAVAAEVETVSGSVQVPEAREAALSDSGARQAADIDDSANQSIVPSLDSSADVDAVVDQLDAAVSEIESTMQNTPAATVEGEDKPLDMARIDARVLDDMLNNAGEVSIFHSRLEEQVGSISFNLTELHQTVARLREQLRKLEIETEAQILHKYNDEKTRHEEFDPLELDRYSGLHQLSRALAESVSDLVSLQHLMTDITRESEALLVQQARVTGELQDALIRSRMLPFERYVSRFERIVRQAAHEQNKSAVLTVTGGSGELDRQVLQRMLPPFEHMLRNAVIHGIESAAERAVAGKPEQGQIAINLVREGAEMVIRVHDDGRGLDAQKIINKAQEQGLLESDQHISDAKAYELILSHGFSTAGKVTQSAGRGVGMDVVANQVKTLGGSLQLNSQKDQGTEFVIRLPLTLAVSQALLVRCGDERFAIPLPAVEGIVRAPLDEIKSNPQQAFNHDGNDYTIRHLGPYLGGPPVNLDAIETPSTPVILIRAGEHSSALIVDELMGSREVVVKSAGPMVSRITGVAGATILGDGSIVVILDVAALIRNETDQRDKQNYVVAQSNEDLRPVVLVVDDSITVRRVTQRLLERNNMKVLLAKDGVDAVAMMQEQIPDLVLLDIEMPRMDGYEVASHIRNSPELEHVPITMITSRVGEKHRARAFELGVDKYLGKPYQENQLLDVIQPLLERSIKQRK